MAAQRSELKAQVASTADSECRSYGAEQGTPVYVQCLMLKDQQRLNATAAAQAAANRQFNCGMDRVGASFGTAEQQHDGMVLLAARGC